jgi:hypothetical protein
VSGWWLWLAVLGCGWFDQLADAPELEADAEPAEALDEPGKWRKLRPKAREQLTEEQQQVIAQLEAIGYADGTREVKVTTSLTVFDEARATPGYNLYNSGHAAVAVLTDLRGEVLHTWQSSFAEAFPGTSLNRRDPGVNHWRRVELGANGDLYAIFEGRGVVRLSRDSEVRWSVQNRAHHDLAVQPDGGVIVLAREGDVIPEVHATKPVLRDYLEFLNNEGEITRRVDLLTALLDSPFASTFKGVGKKAGDVFHTNSFVVLGEQAARLHSEFQPGRVLLSMRNLDALAVLDLNTERFVWVHRGEYAKQHDATVRDDGKLMLFDNSGKPGTSRVLVYELPGMKLAWSYQGTAEAPFRSPTLGTVQALPTGNLLVTESEGGRAFELSPEGEIVWELYNPNRAGESGEFIAALFEVVRLPPTLDLSWLPAAAP